MIIHSSFKPAWWLKNAHLQTIFPAFFRTTKPPRALRRERLTTPDNDFLDIDHCGETGQPIVILLHGLTGSSESGYIKGLQHALAKMGLRTVALNFRGCSGESNRLARCYHSGETEDIHFLYRILREREPETPMAAIGFSLGGNVLLKWLGEQGNRLDLFAAVAVSVPLVLSVCASKLDRGFSKIYRGNLLGELKRYVRLKLQHLETLGIEAEAEKNQTARQPRRNRLVLAIRRYRRRKTARLPRRSRLLPAVQLPPVSQVDRSADLSHPGRRRSLHDPRSAA